MHDAITNEHSKRSGYLRRIAVLVRTYVVDEKVLDLLRVLSGGCYFDLFVTADETDAFLDFGKYQKISHSLSSLQQDGLPICNKVSVLNYADQVMFYSCQQIPDYDFYIMIEDDVHFTKGNASFIDLLALKLRSEAYRDLDLVAPKCAPAWTEWRYYPETVRLFKEPYSVFFPFVGMSRRAILHVNARRHQENRERQGDEPLIFCEGFVPSALMETGEFRIADLLDLFPGCYQGGTFNFGLEPQPLQLAFGEDAQVEIVHPVYVNRKFLERAYSVALGTNRLPHLLQDLKGKYKTLPKPLVDEFTSFIERVLAAAPQ